jgi:hypothetical protein
MRLPRPSGGRNLPVGAVVVMLSVTDVALTEFPLVGLKLQLASDGRLL